MNRFRTACQTLDEFIVTAEVAPPKGADPSQMIEMVRLLKGRVHAVNITDGSRAVLGMSSLAASIILIHHGVEPIYQLLVISAQILSQKPP